MRKKWLVFLMFLLWALLASGAIGWALIDVAEASEPVNPLASLIPHEIDREEHPIARRARLDEVTNEVLLVTEYHKNRWKGDPRMLAAIVLAIGQFETRYASLAPVECVGPGDCDNGKAWHYWQTHTPHERRTDGQLGLFVAAQDAVTAVIRGANYCGGEGEKRLLGAISLYATGKSCDWSGARERLALARKLSRKL